jgi:2-polyprenyl-6-methoxyphenol hydroxylase-like FAD-dependent oxidoreductase
MRVCIVGGGLAGLAMAISLAKSNREGGSDGSPDHDDGLLADGGGRMEICLIEKKDYSSRGAAFGLARNGQAALEEICPELLRELKEIGVPLSSGGYMLPWYLVRDGLLARAREYQAAGEIEMLESTSVTSVRTEGEGGDDSDNLLLSPILVTYEMQEENGSNDDREGGSASSPPTSSSSSATVTRSKSFDVVIGADGVYSYVRTILGAPPAVSSQTKCWRGTIDALPPELSHLVNNDVATEFRLRSGGLFLFNFHTSLPGLLVWTATSKDLAVTSPLELLEGLEGDDLLDAERILRASKVEELEHSTLLATIPMVDCEEDDGGAASSSSETTIATGWGGRGCVTLIGDAAHALRPAVGLGGSLAFEDVAVLTRQLRSVANAGSSVSSKSISEALREFERRRFPRCKAIADDQSRNSEAYYTSNVKDARAKLEWSEAYTEWVFAGPDASPQPPVPMYKEYARSGQLKSEL